MTAVCGCRQHVEHLPPWHPRLHRYRSWRRSVDMHSGAWLVPHLDRLGPGEDVRQDHQRTHLPQHRSGASHPVGLEEGGQASRSPQARVGCLLRLACRSRHDHFQRCRQRHVDAGSLATGHSGKFWVFTRWYQTLTTSYRPLVLSGISKQISAHALWVGFASLSAGRCFCRQGHFISPQP